MSDYLSLYRGWYYYRRRVPENLRPYAGRRFVKVALKTQNIEVARQRAIILNESIEKSWADAVKSPHLDVGDLYKDAVTAARLRGFAYKTVSELADGDIDQLAARLREIALTPAAVRPQVITALLGGVDRPDVMLSGAFDVYLSAAKDKIAGKGEAEIKKWKAGRERSFKYFLEAVGDKPFSQICRQDVLVFRRWWMEKIEREQRRPESANKSFKEVKDLIRLVALDCDMDMDVRALFDDVGLKAMNKSRKPFEAAFVQDQILAPGKLDGMNPEARALVWIMADTGARPDEIIGLRAEDIFLLDDIPYIWIRPYEGHSLKTPQSDRQIPLVGAAAAGARLLRGINHRRYANADSASAAVNKYMKAHDLRPEPGQTLYSLRHTFKDRLRDAGAPEEVIDNLMGHKPRGPKYGRGHVLETKLKWLSEIAFKLPEK